jgi:hypothetical protein
MTGPSAPTPSSSSSRRVRRAGTAVLVAGWAAAAAVYVAADGGDAGAGPDARARQRELQEVERLGGRASVQTVKFDEGLASLWQGRRLAFTLAILSLAIAGGCRYVAGLMDEELDP